MRGQWQTGGLRTGAAKEQSEAAKAETDGKERNRNGDAEEKEREVCTRKRLGGEEREGCAWAARPIREGEGERAAGQSEGGVGRPDWAALERAAMDGSTGAREHGSTYRW